MWFITDVLDVLATLVLIVVFLFFLTIGSAWAILSLKKLCENVLQPIRNRFEKPVIISSGFRSAELNKAIGSSSKSQHCKGEAADIEIYGIDNKILAQWIHNNTKYDQLILEFYKESDPQSGWVHVSFTDKCRKQFLKAYKDQNGKTRYMPWQ